MDFRFLFKTESDFPQVSKISTKNSSSNILILKYQLQEISLTGQSKEFFCLIAYSQWRLPNLLVTQRLAGKSSQIVLFLTFQRSVRELFFYSGEILHAVRKL